MPIPPNLSYSPDDWRHLAWEIKEWGVELGFRSVAVAGIALPQAVEERLDGWVANGFHGEMEYMVRHGTKRTRPGELVTGTQSVIVAALDYLHGEGEEPLAVLRRPDLAYISRYALGRDYHKVVRRRLQRLAERIEGRVGDFGYRVFTDSAPVMEKPLAASAGIGWVGKHSNLLSRSGSWFFLGEIYTDLPLPADAPISSHCGSCTACIDACPTGAIVAPYVVDARRCISYLTIELQGSIPEEWRAAIGNRIYGCDDCQLFCPWNRRAPGVREPDFLPRHGLDSATLATLFGWSEEEFMAKSEGSPLRRLGYRRWLRNLAVALGNAPTHPELLRSLRARLAFSDEMVRDHVRWALERHEAP